QPQAKKEKARRKKARPFLFLTKPPAAVLALRLAQGRLRGKWKAQHLLGFFISSHNNRRHPERSEGSQRCIERHERHERQLLLIAVILSEAQRSRRTRTAGAKPCDSKARS